MYFIVANIKYNSLLGIFSLALKCLQKIKYRFPINLLSRSQGHLATFNFYYLIKLYHLNQKNVLPFSFVVSFDGFGPCKNQIIN